MKMRKKNLWNRLFQSKELTEQEKRYHFCLEIVGFYGSVDTVLREAGTLPGLLEAHKFLWSKGYRNDNLGPDKCGMFRCESIEKMGVEDVFLGNIYGLFTKTLRYWDNCEDSMDLNGRSVRIKDVIYNQYARHLRSNVDNIYGQARRYILDYEILNGKRNPTELW